jgi:hypothetical protein
MCYLSKNLQNTSHFVTLFSAHGGVVVRFAIFHIVSCPKKSHSSMVCECWWAPDGIGLPWFVKGKRVGRSAKLYKRAQKCKTLSQKLAHFCMEHSKNPIASR